MNSDQLRQFADRLEPMAAAPGFDGLDVPAFVAWLRQCAEQRPVAWRWIPSAAWGGYVLTDNQEQARFAAERLTVEPLYAAPAPTAQREPTPSERLREAGFTRRDNRIECGECGKLFTPQFLQIHKCGGGDE